MLVYLSPEEIEAIKAFRYPSDTTLSDLCRKIETQQATGAPQPRKPVCPKCGSDQISCDAVSAWNVDANAWDLTSAYETAICLDCSHETKDLPFVVWEGGPRGKWVVDPAHPLSAAAAARINDDAAVNPGFVDLSQPVEA